MENENKLYLECYSGISGDMTVAALLDLGADEKVLRDVLESLPVSGYRVEIKRVVKSGIDASDFNVILDESHENNDHDMVYLHGHEEGCEHHHHHHGHGEGCEHHHHHTHEGNGGHGHRHEHRGMREIRRIIEQGRMTERARSIALRIFEILAEAESKAHNVPVD